LYDSLDGGFDPKERRWINHWCLSDIKEKTDDVAVFDDIVPALLHIFPHLSDPLLVSQFNVENSELRTKSSGVGGFKTQLSFDLFWTGQ